MQTRLHTMTFLLVLTLLTNLFRHERGSVTALGEVHKSEIPSRRRILERLLRLSLTSSSDGLAAPISMTHEQRQQHKEELRQQNQQQQQRRRRQQSQHQHLLPARTSEEASEAERIMRPLEAGSSLLNWFHSNRIPTRSAWDQRGRDRDFEEEGAGVGDSPSFDYSLPTPNSSSSSVVAEDITNLFFPSSGREDDERGLPPLLRQYELSSNLEDSTLRRRHAQGGDPLEALIEDAANTDADADADTDAAAAAAAKPSAKELRKRRKLEKKNRRESKKKKRDKEKRRRRKRLKEILKNEDVILHNIDGEEYLDCCPSKLIVVEKQVGKDRNNHAVEVRPSHQYFYERVCLQGIENKECVFPPKSLKKGVVTRCTQQFSYVQAQVRPYRSDKDWHLDYIYVRSGCSCQVSVTTSKKSKKNKG